MQLFEQSWLRMWIFRAISLAELWQLYKTNHTELEVERFRKSHALLYLHQKQHVWEIRPKNLVQLKLYFNAEQEIVYKSKCKV